MMHRNYPNLALRACLLSIAVAVTQGDASPARLVLGAAGPRPRILPAVSTQLQNGTEHQIRAAAEADLDVEFTEIDAYQKRMHLANIMRAVRDMRRP